ncbi:hypothetical protein MXD61_11325 [Frankia sp. AgPm24]|uniref:hypothetical protein n=1 Tax=Frankia sp. AgPm24 TaxID=631128 RepID=UPI00200EE1BE|nr:hypothetical protein [Frankia sp. AgPm24]MCK9922463.1 hypothetical protein [Frankia sp. AgPm24]
MAGTWWDETGPDGHPSRRLDRHDLTELPPAARGQPHPAPRGRRRRRRRQDPDSLAARLRYALVLAALGVPPTLLALCSLAHLHR